MGADRWRNIAGMVAVVTAAAILLSLIWRVSYLYTLIGAATWSFVGHIITADDDMAGGWSNPDGTCPMASRIRADATVPCAAAKGRWWRPSSFPASAS
jgi:hypothetical protein